MSNHNTNTAQFTFDSKIKLFTVVLMAIGIVSLGVTFAIDGEYNHIRFWTNILHNTVFFVGIAFAALLFISTHTMAWGGWQTLFKRVPEAMMTFLYVGVGLVALIGVAIALDLPGTDLLYLWSDEAALDPANEHFDKLVAHKSTLLNPMTYFLTALVVALWSFFAAKIRSLSIKQDTTPYTVTEGNSLPEETVKTRLYAAIFLPVAGFSSAFAIWLWVMSVDTHWYSTLFAWYATVSMFVSCVCVMLLTIMFLKHKGYLESFTANHMHDLGKYIFGFSVFWTYLWFSQFLLIWFANNGEETQYFFLRFEQFKPIFFINLIINFALPFLILIMNSSKRTVGTIGFTAGLVLLGHWIDFYQMIKPGVWYNYEHAQHLSHAHGDDHGHGHEDDAHSSTYRLEDHNNFNGGKAVLTDYQDGHDDQGHGAEHTDDTHSDEHNDGDTTTTAHDDHGHETPHHDDTHSDDHDHNHGTTGGDHNHDTNDHDSHGDDAHGSHHETQFVMGIHFPGLLELGTMAGFLGLFLFVMFFSLSKAPLYPPNDPYIRESEHHEVWPYPAEGHDDHH
ncbi:MAG: hypothetical protein GY810_02195 [Aureispira sp.]|nr:hypothetical protein [Aureispira sp.]